MSFSSTASGRPVFHGESAEEAEDFIFAIKERAYAEGKQRDTAWIAEFVSICFAKAALRWYEELDEDTQNDWRLLKRAILTEYQDAIPTISTIPTAPLAALSTLPCSTMTVRSSPAVTPPKTSSILKGRISVESESSSLQGYIGVRCAYNEWCTITKTMEGAATFEVNLSDRTIKFQDGQSFLAVRAYQRDWKLGVGSTHYSGLYKGEASVPGWSDSIQCDLWSLGVNNLLIATWPTVDGGSWYLETAAWTADKRIYLVPDCSAFATEYGASTHIKITLYFQPLP